MRRFAASVRTPARRLSSLHVSDEVRHAVHARLPVVALESTIVTHGLPYPQNVQMAQEVEAVVRAHGAVPATTAFLAGRARVGLTAAELELLGGPAGEQHPVKVSRRDIPYVLANKLSGGTTVASTMLLAHRARIPVFATGGLGGVHRGVAETWDISADMEELGRTPVAVVCSGIKSILDIPKSVEYLETKGCLLATVGQSNVPNFFTADSGVKSPFVVGTACEAASLVDAGNSFELNAGYVFCVPPPASELQNSELDEIIARSLALADSECVQGKDITPFLLRKVWEATKGKSVETNIALVKNNAAFAAQMAVSLSEMASSKSSVTPNLDALRIPPLPKSPVKSHVSLELEGGSHALAAGIDEHTHTHTHSHDHGDGCSSCEGHSHDPPPGYHSNPDVVCIGSLSEDITCTLQTKSIEPTSYPGSIESRVGGTAYNVALSASLYGAPTALVTRMGRHNPLVRKLKQDMSLFGLVDGTGGSRYVSMNDEQGELVVACADMDPEVSTTAIVDTLQTKSPKVVVFDANLGNEQMRSILRCVRDQRASDAKKSTVIFEPTSVPKSAKLGDHELPVFPNHLIDIATPNRGELLGIFDALMAKERFDVEHWLPVVMAMPVGNAENRYRMAKYAAQHAALKSAETDGVFKACLRLLPFIPNIYVTLGKEGVLACQLLANEDVSAAITADDSTNPLSLLLTDDKYSFSVRLVYFPTLSPDLSVASVNGAGDSFCGVVAAQLANNAETPLATLIETGMRASELSIQTVDSVSTEIRDLHLQMVSGSSFNL